MSLSITLFNHVLEQSPYARAQLAESAGRRVAWVVPPVCIAGVITPDGWLAECQGEPEATLRLPITALLARLSGGFPMLNDVVLEGESELAVRIAHISRHLAWHWVEDLSSVVGDIAAFRIERTVQTFCDHHRTFMRRLQESGVDYLQEEASLLARRRDVARFIADVDTLRDDVARCEKRLVRLQHALHHTPSHKM